MSFALNLIFIHGVLFHSEKNKFFRFYLRALLCITLIPQHIRTQLNG